VRAQALREALLDTLGAGPTQDRWTPESIARGALTLRALSERLPEIAPLIAGSTEG
jgi:hypothetical protein